MATDLAKPIKAQILANLQTLVSNGVISSFVSLDKTPNPLADTPSSGYPFAIVGMPRVTSDFQDQATNERVYRFDLLFVMNASELTNPDTDVEHLIDQVLNQFDSNYTLAGTAEPAVLPAKVDASPISTTYKTLIAIVVTLECRTLYTTGT